jgi:N-acetylglucosamine malate deacetylase 1
MLSEQKNTLNVTRLMKKLDFLAIGAHPDDVELSCVGTLLHQKSLGHSFGLLDLTLGELGTRGTPAIRTQEAMAAAELLGAEVRIQLDLGDGFFTHDKEHLLPIIEVLRKYKPTVVLANALDDRHPDHGRAAKLTADACFLAGLIRIETFDEDGLQEPWRPRTIYHYIQDQNRLADLIIDITPYIKQKMEAIQCYKSQFFDPNSNEPITPISSRAFLDSIMAKNALFGRSINVDFAEGFEVTRPIGLKDLMDGY